MTGLTRNPAGRTAKDNRPLVIDTNVTRYAEGSVMVKTGHTHVLCTASVEEDVPRWLAKTGKGWVTAEYSMLPRSTHTRMKRDRNKVSGRTQEIQRLIGRALRSTVDFEALGENSIIVDCDVIQADGGTRTAAITGGFVALAMAVQKINPKALIDTVSAVSIGLKEGQALVDLDYDEDSTCDVDMNFVVTGSQKFVEVQGTAEKTAFDLDQMNAMAKAALNTCNVIREAQLKELTSLGIQL